MFTELYRMTNSASFAPVVIGTTLIIVPIKKYDRFDIFIFSSDNTNYIYRISNSYSLPKFISLYLKLLQYNKLNLRQ